MNTTATRVKKITKNRMTFRQFDELLKGDKRVNLTFLEKFQSELDLDIEEILVAGRRRVNSLR